MFSTFFAKPSGKHAAHALYGKVVARSRDALFYDAYDVPDTLDGRFEMLTMHLFMLHHRLKDEGAQARDISQRVFDAFIADMDAAMREVAVGDQIVPKRIKKMTRVFYGRTGAYEKALAQDDAVSELSQILARNIDPENPVPKDRLARYMFSEVKKLSATETSDLLQKAELYQGDIT